MMMVTAVTIASPELPGTAGMVLLLTWGMDRLFVLFAVF
jgi:hypothetical protein